MISKNISFLLCVAFVAGLLWDWSADDACSAEALKEWKVSTDFEGGSAEVKLLNQETGVIHIHPAVQLGLGWPCWWYLRVDGLEKGRNLTLKVSRNPKPYRKDEVLSRAWSQPARAAISIDNQTWTQTSAYQRDGDVVSYQIKSPAETVWLAWGPPFLPSHADELLKRVVEDLPEAEMIELARTQGDRPVRGVRIGGGSGKQPAKYGIWVQARQHAWEAGSSWVGKGFIDWVASDDPAAVELRAKAVIYFVPIMDVDNAFLGAGGKDAVPRDHNRDWSEMPNYPEVKAAQRRILELDKTHQFDLFVDLHNPGASEQRPYFFAPYNLREMPELRQRNYDRWHAMAHDFISDPLPLESEYKFANYIQTKEEHDRMSSQWVSNHTAEHVVSTTLETVWNTPHSTQTGYMAVGRQLGQTAARYLLTSPRKK